MSKINLIKKQVEAQANPFVQANREVIRLFKNSKDQIIEYLKMTRYLTVMCLSIFLPTMFLLSIMPQITNPELSTLVLFLCLGVGILVAWYMNIVMKKAGWRP